MQIKQVYLKQYLSCVNVRLQESQWYLEENIFSQTLLPLNYRYNVRLLMIEETVSIQRLKLIKHFSTYSKQK